MTQAGILLVVCLALFFSITTAVTFDELWKFNSRLLKEAPKGFQFPLINATFTKKVKRTIFQTCAPGWTGLYCESPICSKSQPLRHHDGTANDGEIIYNNVSPTCNENFVASFDNYMMETKIQIKTIFHMINPTVRLYAPNGNRIIPNSVSKNYDGSGEISTYDDLIITYGPGQYTLAVMANSEIPCAVSVLSKTHMVIDGGFVQNVTDDNVQETPSLMHGVERNPVQYIISYYGFKPYGLYEPGHPHFVTFYKHGVQIVPPYNVRTRYNCNAMAWAGPVICSNTNGIYHLWISGLDNTGNLWNRMYIFLCDPKKSSTPSGGGITGVTTPSPNLCMNGGTLTIISNVTKCYCGQLYEGYQCETKRCFNDGTLGPNGICVCQPGFTGTFCQDVVCRTPSMGNFDMSGSSIAFVIRGTKTMASYWNDAYQAAKLTIDDIQSINSEFLQSFVLVIFANNQLLKLGEYTDYQTFLLDFNNASSYLVDAQSCTDSVYFGVSVAMNTRSFTEYKRSSIYLWTDALPNDDVSVQHNLYGQVAYYRSPIWSMLPYGSNDTCIIDTNDLSYRGFRQMAAFSQGLLLRENSYDLVDMHALIALTARNAVHLASNDLLDQCSYSPTYQTFFVDESFMTFFVYATGALLKISVSGPNRRVFLPTYSMSYINTYIYLYKNAPKGNYLISVSSDESPAGPCAYRVIGNANTYAFMATTSDINTDMNQPYGYNPIYNTYSYMVAHINNFPVNYTTTNGLTAELTVWTNEAPNRTRTMVYASNGYYRDSCDYHFQFGTWKCPVRNMMFYAQLYVEDSTGYIMSRVITGFCVTQQFCFGDNCNGCQNGGVPDPRNNATCLCPPGYNGTLCTQIICQNGGTPNVYDCLCTDGWAGTFCELSKCIKTDYVSKFSSNKKSLAMLVHNSLSTRGMILSMQQNFAQTVNEIVAQHPIWINNYQLLSFSDIGAPIPAADTSDSGLFVTAFNNLVANNQQNLQFSCNNLRVAESLYAILKSPKTTQFGIIYVFLMGLPNVNMTVMYEVNEMLQMGHVVVNFVQASPMPCGASLSDPGMQILFNIAASTGGTVFLANSNFVGSALHSIPTSYAKSYVYQNFVPDCSNRSYFYVPIDSEVQTMQLQIFGDLDDSPNNPAVTYLLPDGTAPNFQTLYNDIGSNARYDEIFKPCDSGWRRYDRKCYWFDHNKKSWDDAALTCNGLNATLAMVANSETEQYLYFNIVNNPTWIGLNDRATLGTWVWSLQRRNTISLSQTQFTNWGSEMPLNDSARRCVTDSKSTKWIVTDCNSLQFYACTKPIYDYKQTFGQENANFLPPGMMTIGVKTYKDPGGPPAPCEVKVTSQSGIKAWIGYAFNQHADLDSTMPIQDSNANYFTSHILSRSNAYPGVLQYAHFYVTDNMQMTGVQQFNKRDTGSCTWEYVSKAFQCPQTNTSSTAFHPFLHAKESGFQTALTGIDYNGYLFQRIRPTVCYIRNPLKNCENGGVYALFSRRCVCPPDFIGDRCEFPICYNNGNLSGDSSTCVCPAISQTTPLYTGSHCEFPVCIRGSNKGLPLPRLLNKTFVLILDGANNGLMADVFTNLKQILNNVTQFVPGVYKSYIAVVVRDNSYDGPKVISNPIMGTNVNAWITAITNELTANSYTSTLNGRLIFTGLARFLSSPLSKAILQPQSHVFVLTGAIAIDGVNLHRVEDYIAPFQLQINFIYIGDDTNPGGASVNPYNDTNLLAMYRLMYITNGGFYQVHDWKNARSLWFVGMAQRVNSYMIHTSYNYNCTSHKEYFQVGSSPTNILLDIYTSTPPNVVFTDNNGTAVSNVNIDARSHTNYLYSADITNPGVWMLSIEQNTSNAGFCYAVVRGIDKKNKISWAFTQDTADNGAHTNDAVLYPDGRSTSRNSILANVPFGYAAFAQIYDPLEFTLLWSSPMIQRTKCTFNYVTRDSFPACPQENFLVAITTYDDQMIPVRRAGMVHCVNYHE